VQFAGRLRLCYARVVDVRDEAFDWGGEIVGREAELMALDEFVASGGVPRAFVLTGVPGIGKTTLWEAGVELARRRGVRVLSARASDAETTLSSAALIDLFDGVGREELASVPPPQLHALEVALFRAAPLGAPPETHAIAVGLLNTLRALTARGPLLLAIDDVQWLDRGSGDALAFAARRLEGEPVAFLLARRPGSASALERAFVGRPLERLDVELLSLGATRRVLSGRLGLSVPRTVLRRVFETTLGNPLFTLEVGRTLAARGTPGIGDDLPVPDAVEDLLGTRVVHLTDGVRRLLLALALQGDLRVWELTALADATTLEDALDAGVVVLDGDRVRPSHPLLAAAAKTRARARERRELHLELAGVVADEELRALHLALATVLPDESLAATVAAAGAWASARGAAQQAVVLAEHALRLTPPGSEDWSERLLALAGYLEVAGERQRVTDLLTPELDRLPQRDRIRAWLRLAEGGSIRSIADTEDYLDRALAASAGDPVLRAYVLSKKSHSIAASASAIREAEGWVLEALPVARRAGPELERLALHGLGWARALRGLPIDDVCERFRAASDAAGHITDSPEPVAGLRLLWRGHVDGAREVLTQFKELADARGEEVSYALQRMNVCDLELRAGGWDAAARLLDEWESADRQLLIRATYERSRALLAAGRGLADEAERWAASAFAGAEPGEYRWQMLESLRARGIAALLAGDVESAADSLGAVWEHTEREGVDEPGAFPVAPDLVEALVELGELERSRRVTGRLRRLSEEQDHPWGLASAARSEALPRLASDTYDEDAARQLADAADAYGALGLRFDRARSLLSLGRAQRRLRKWAAARDSLELAAAAFDELGSPGWSEQARSELGRVGGRRRQAGGGLTPAERRVVELAADGLANKEIAQSLFVTVRTVEVHLKHAYAKLGVRSRTQLARRLSERA
jgi:DNA-binding CsgD family transcriptional regulator/tetratricopeptide (TPR) repeat protein